MIAFRHRQFECEAPDLDTVKCTHTLIFSLCRSNSVCITIHVYNLRFSSCNYNNDLIL